jgi:hypothetical protein
MRYKSLTRVLALDLHPRRFGYVVLENPDRLLDWGVCSARTQSRPNHVLIRQRLRPLLELWRPSLVVIRPGGKTPQNSDPLRQRLLKGVLTEAKEHRASVLIIPSQSSSLTKYESAQLVTKRFPVLAGHLPPKRRPWESENYRMSMFTAAAVATAHLSTRETRK